jgi:hypothetical protein
MAGSITEEDRTFVETWEHVGVGSRVIIRLDARGDERHEVINGQRRFMVTTEERIINQDRMQDAKEDPFLNGAFRPIVVPDTVTVETNPNALGEDQIRKIFASSDLAWNEWMQQIDSPATLRRMMDLAESADISLKRYKDVERRYNEVKPIKRVHSTDPLVQNFIDPKPGGGSGVPTVASGTANPRRQGGMSSDYR